MAAKKKVTKKKKTTKKTTREKRSKLLRTAPKQHTFKLRDGRHLTSLFDLVDELERMSDEEFFTFVDHTRNDFSNWIRDIYDDSFLAEDVARAIHRLDAQRIVLKRMVTELLKKK